MKSTALPNRWLEIMDPADRKSLGKAGRTVAERTSDNAIKRERDLHKLISNELLRRGIVNYHSRMDRKTTIGTGLPDYAFVLNGRPITMEVKMPGQGLSDKQLEMRAKMIAPPNGWSYIVVYSFEQVLLTLNHQPA